MKKNMLSSVVALAAFGCTGVVLADSLGATARYDRNEIRLYTEPLAYEVVRDGKTVVVKTPIGVKLDGACRREAKLVSTKTAALEGCVASPVYKKGAVCLAGSETVADFGDFAVRLVARKDGAAYRFELKKAATVDDENAALTIPAAARCSFNRTKSFGCEETMPEFADAKDLAADEKKFYYLPFVYSVDGVTVSVTDTDVRNYPVWNFKEVEKKADGVTLKSWFAPAPKATQRVGGWGKELVEKGGRWVRVTETEPYLVKTTAAQTLPWRTFMLADSPAKLVESDLSFALAAPQAEDVDFSWIKPGKVAWDWWNAFDNKGDPKGCTTETYKRFIDFAAKNGVEYVIFDEGWSAKLNIWQYSPVVDVPYLIDYANKKGVGIILWMAWAQVYGEEERVAEHFAKLGAKGFKVDFMDRGDAEISNFLAAFAKACAKHRMIVDYHGVYRPVGLHRQYPNVVNYEGIHGLEQMKWAPRGKDMVYNDVACTLLRMSAGPMDYTPGAMLNYPIGAYEGNTTFPGSVGTRAHQMALMALYEAPLQMLADSPTNYEKNMECFAFMAKTPVVWDAVVGLGGCPESMVALARKAKDGAWYAAAITNKEARDYTLDTSFLGAGEWQAEIFRDDAACDKEPAKYVHERKTVKAGDKLPLHMAVGGGFVVRFSK